MPEDPNDFVAESFPLLVSELQRADVQRFDEEQKKQAELRAALRQQTPGPGMTTGELIKKMEGDPQDAQRRLEEDLARITKEAQAAVAQKDKSKEALPVGHFPPPPSSSDK